MKVLLYTEGLKVVGKSGLGKAIKHQMKALDSVNVQYTLNPKDDYDILIKAKEDSEEYLLDAECKEELKEKFIKSMNVNY